MIGKFVDGDNCFIHFLTKFSCGIDADGIGIGYEAGVMGVVTSQIIDRATAFFFVETPVEFGFSAVV